MKEPFLVLLIIFSLLIAESANAQKEAANWYFGNGAGLSFKSGSPSPLQNGKLQTIEGSATISDINGNLLFYTDGSVVYDRSHNLMLNGSNLKGNVSSTQSAIIIPRPAMPGRYFIFTVDKPDYFRIKDDPIEGVHYSEVDMSLNNGKGGIIEGKKNIHLITYNSNDALEREYKSSEKISAVIAGDCVSYWVVTQFANKFYSFNVNKDGVNTSPEVSTLANNFRPIINDQEINVTAAGYLKVSPNGKKMAAAYTGTSLGSPKSGSKKTGKVFIYDFDDNTGMVSNEELLLANTYPYGIEFSPESTKLYVTANSYDSEDRLKSGELYQFDLTNNNIIASKTLLNSSNNVAGALQLAIDGKIYRAGYPMGEGAVEHNFLSVINKPELAGTASSYSHNSINIKPRDVKLGLPPFIQSLFNSNFEVENLCFGDETIFKILGSSTYDSVIWDFGDGAISTDNSPVHIYQSSGEFTVSLTKIINGIPLDPVCEPLNIIEIPNVPDDFILTQCDVRDSNPNDGLSEFNLQLAKDYLTNGNPGLQVYFYEDENTAKNDPFNENSLQNIYRNRTQLQTIYGKVLGFGTDCFAITPIKLNTTGSKKIYPNPAFGCRSENDSGDFNFANIEKTIISELSLEENVKLTFHKTDEEAKLGISALPILYSSPEVTLFIRATKDDNCYGFGLIDLKLNDFPDIETKYNYQMCSKDLPFILGDELQLENSTDYSYIWSTGELTPSIKVYKSGLYTLNLEDKIFGCGRTIEYYIDLIHGPEITNIEIDNKGIVNDITIFTVENNQNTRYSLNDKNGPYQSSNLFQNIPGGSYILYAKNDNDCEISEKEILVFGMPEYFTPNNDGYNDTWRPLNIGQLEHLIDSIKIYDRYGKLLKQLHPNGSGWDGIHLNNPMPSNEYWYTASFSNGQSFSGHFSLIR